MNVYQTIQLLTMNFPQRLVLLRKERKYTQQTLADKVGVHLSQIRRYESAETQPTLDVIRKLSIALSVSSDTLIFDNKEREPDDDLRLQFEAISQFTPEEKKIVKVVMEGLILKHDSNRFSATS